MAAAATPLPSTSYPDILHVDASYGPVVRLTCVDLGNPDAAPVTKDYVPGRYILGRHEPFEITSKKCSRHQADLLVSSHTVAVTPKGKPAMRITRAGGSEAFVMSHERNYQIFDGDIIGMGETKFQVTFNFLGKLKEIEEALEQRKAAKNAKPDPSPLPPVSNTPEDDSDSD